MTKPTNASKERHMKVAGATEQQIHEAAKQVNVRVYNLRVSGHGFAFTLKTGQHDRERGAVGWDGHRDFFRALYKLAPRAVVRTSMAVYRGAEDFEQEYQENTLRGALVRLEKSFPHDRGQEWACPCGASGYEGAGSQQLLRCPTCNRPIVD